MAFPEESEGNPVPTVRADEGILTAYREPQYIGAFIDPDSENIDTLTFDDTVVFIGEFIDPDDEAWLNIESPRQMIGRIVDPSEDGAGVEVVRPDADIRRDERPRLRDRRRSSREVVEESSSLGTVRRIFAGMRVTGPLLAIRE